MGTIPRCTETTSFLRFFLKSALIVTVSCAFFRPHLPKVLRGSLFVGSFPGSRPTPAETQTRLLRSQEPSHICKNTRFRAGECFHQWVHTSRILSLPNCSLDDDYDADDDDGVVDMRLKFPLMKIADIWRSPGYKPHFSSRSCMIFGFLLPWGEPPAGLHRCFSHASWAWWIFETYGYGSMPFHGYVKWVNIHKSQPIWFRTNDNPPVMQRMPPPVGGSSGSTAQLPAVQNPGNPGAGAGGCQSGISGPWPWNFDD